MPDPLAGQPAADASATAPVELSADIEKIIEARVTALIEPRIQGFQRLVSARDEELTALRGELENERLAGLSEDERADILEQAKDRRIQELESRNELLQLGPSYGEEMPYFEQLLAGASAEDQLKTLRAYADHRLAQANPKPVPDEQKVDVPDVDLNRPLRPTSQGGTRLPDGSLMDAAIADRILGAMTAPLASVTQQRLRPTD